MTRSTLTRERIELIANFHRAMTLPPSHAEIEELARMALAAMDSEPVGSISIDRLLQLLYQFDGANECAASIGDQEYALECGDVASALRELLSCRSALPVADVVAWSNPNEERKCDIRWRRHDVEPGPLYRHAQPAPEYPETLSCPLLLEPGLRFGKGVKIRLVLEAIQRRAEHYAELEAMAPEERAEYDANIEALKAMLPQSAPVVPKEWAIVDAVKFCKETGRQDAGAAMDAWNACCAAMLLAGNSPVIPDGLIGAVNRLLDSDGSRGCYSAIRCGDAHDEIERLLAAAQKEVKS